jgi:uncharacterized protein YfaT (DUF1175 family)
MVGRGGGGVTRTVHLQLVVDGDPEPLVLASRTVRDGDHLGAYALAVLCIETAVRLIGWQVTKDRFGDVLEQAGESA